MNFEKPRVCPLGQGKKYMGIEVVHHILWILKRG